jgi:autotransporter-associated beta strand protein
MKTTMTSTSSPAWSLIEILQLMKTKLTILKFLIILCGTFATTAAFGQTIYTWTNATAIDIGVGVNWNPNGQPSGSTQDTAQWDGVVPGNLALKYITGWPNTGYGTSGVNIVLTANQIGNVTITAPSTGNSPSAGIFGITNDSATAVLTIGDFTANQLAWAVRPGTAGTVHGFVNNSANAAIINPSWTPVFGGGVNCELDFGGTGDWIVNHNLIANNGPGPFTVVWEGPGTMTWSNGHNIYLSSTALGPVTNNSGTIVVKSSGLLLNFVQAVGGNAVILNNSSVFKFDAPSVSDTIARVISGTGTVQVNNGTLTLSGANTYTGNTVLSGGELIVDSAENLGTSGPLGVGGTITFSGGTLGFSSVNTYDYSPRFDTSASQLYSFDTAGQNVTFTNALTSSGGSLTKLGSGTLTLTGANTYSGTTTVSAGKLVIQGSQGNGSITVANSTALGVNQGGQQITPASLTVGTSSSATLEFNGVNNTATAAISTGPVSVGGPIMINVNSGSFLVGSHYPLLSFTGPPPGVTLGTLVGAGGNLTTNGSTIQLNVTSLAFVWSGLGSGNWDITTPNNWKVNGANQPWANGGTALFDDTITTANTNVTVNFATIQPASTTVNNTKPYSITSSGANFISTGSLTKNGNGPLALAGGLNTYSGATTLNGGITTVGVLAPSGSPSDIGAAGPAAGNLVLNGGTLQYTGGSAVTSDHLFTLGTGGGTIDDEGAAGLHLNNVGPIVMNGTGARTLTLNGNSVDELDAALSDNGGATALLKAGSGTWVLTGTNSQSGATTINGGTVQVGTGGTTSSIGTGTIGMNNNSSLDFNVSGTLTVGAINGSGSLTNDGSGTLILPGNNAYSVGTTINNGTVQAGTGGATGTLSPTAPIANNGTLIFNSTSDSTIAGVISGTGNLIKRGSGVLKFLGADTYTGTTTIDLGAQLQVWEGNAGANASSAITNNGTLIMARQDNGVAIYAGPISGDGKLMIRVSNGNNGDSTLTGSNSYTGGTYLNGGGLILGNNSTPGGGAITGNVFLTNDVIHATFSAFEGASIAFNRPDDFTFPDNIVGEGSVTQEGSGRLTLTGMNDYTNGTTITSGILQVGAGGITGSAGTGSITDNSELDYDRSDSVTVSRVISGGGSLVQFGSGKLILTADNTYTGTTTVSNGTLVVNGANAAVSTYVAGGRLGGTGTLNGPVTLDAGTTLTPGASVGTLTINSDLSFGGNLAIEVNKSLSPSNDLVVVSGVLTNTGTGTLTVSNLGPALAVGDTFTLFSQPVLNGAAMTVIGGGATWTNNLAVDGSISVVSIPVVTPPILNYTRIGNSLQFTWTGSFKLQAQTNSLSVGIRSNWGDYPGGGTSPITVPIDATQATVFFRLAPAP